MNVRLFVLLALLGLASPIPAASAEDFAPPSFDTLSIEVEYEGSATEAVSPPIGLTWQKFSNHTHTNYSPDSSTPLAERISLAASEGADSISITDHGTVGACTDPSFVPVGNCIPMWGEEWGSVNGDIGLLNFDPAGGTIGGSTPASVVTQAQARGATVILNHPFVPGSPWLWGDLPLGFHGIEVWTTMIYLFSGSEEAGHWWHDYLVGGRIAFAIGGADWHFSTAHNLEPCNYVLAASNNPDDIQDGVEAGRIAIAKDPTCARAFLWCDSDGDGVFETPTGANLIVSATRSVTFRIETFDALGLPLVCYTRDGQALSATVGSGAPWVLDLTASVGPKTKDFLRVELQNPSDPSHPRVALTNPVYVNYTVGDCDTDGLADALEDTIGTNIYSADGDGDGVSDRFEVAYDGDPAAYDPYNPDTNPTGTDMNANTADTDEDGISDAQELTFGLDPLDSADGGAVPVASSWPCLALIAIALFAACVSEPWHVRQGKAGHAAS